MNNFVGIPNHFFKKHKMNFEPNSPCFLLANTKPRIDLHVAKAHNHFHILSKINANSQIVCFFNLCKHTTKPMINFCILQRHKGKFTIFPKSIWWIRSSTYHINRNFIFLFNRNYMFIDWCLSWITFSRMLWSQWVSYFINSKKKTNFTSHHQAVFFISPILIVKM